MKPDRIPPGFSWPIDIRGLERETRRFLGVGFLAGVLALAALGFVWRHEQAVSRAKTAIIPATSDEDPFHRTPTAGPRVPLRPATPVREARAASLLRRTGLSTIPPQGRSFGRLPGIAEHSYEVRPDTPNLPISGSTPIPAISGRPSRFDPMGGRFHPGDFSMSEELLSVETLSADEETRFRGVVILNPGSPRTMRGIVPVPSFYTFQLSLHSAFGRVERLARPRSIHQPRTRVPETAASPRTNIPMRYPFIYIGCGDTWEYLPNEAKEAGIYLKNGGFAVFETSRRGWKTARPRPRSASSLSMRSALRRTWKSSERSSALSLLFRFSRRPPARVGSEALSGWSDNRIRKPVNCLEGVWIGPRMVAIYSNKGYGSFWPDDSNSDPQRKMGINMLAFALLQEGGKIEKRYDRSLEPGVAVQRWMSGEVQPLSGGNGGGSGAVRARNRWTRETMKPDWPPSSQKR